MKIILIQPKAHQDNPDYVNEPLGLGYLAAILLDSGLTDVHVRTSLFDDYSETIKLARDAHLIGLTATSPMIKSALYISREIKAVNPGALVVLGGAHATALPEESARLDPIDVVVRGEGEITFLELARALEQGTRDFKAIPGLTFLSKGKTVHTPHRDLIQDLDHLPFPARHLYKLERFLDRGETLFGDRGSWIFSSRGCPYKCTYCASNILWTRKWRPRSSENILEEIRFLVEHYHVNRINFADDTFTVSPKRVREFCSLLKQSGLPITWGCNIRVDTVDRDLLVEMSANGCTDVWIGAESGSPRILKHLKKTITPQQIEQVFGWAREAGLQRRGYFMIGSPEENLESITETEKLIDLVEPDSTSISIFTPYPGCEAYRNALEEGFDPKRLDWSQIDLYNRVLRPTRHLTIKEIKTQHTRLLEKYHLIISTRGKTMKTDAGPISTQAHVSTQAHDSTQAHTEVVGIDQAGRWHEHLQRLPQNLNDVYFFPEYCRAFQQEGYGAVQCFIYREGDDLFVHVFLKRHIEQVAGKTITPHCYDMETPYGYGGPVATSMDLGFLTRAHQALSEFCRAENIVCEFVRFHPLTECLRYSAGMLPLSFNRLTVQVDVTRDKDAIWKSYTGTGRNMIRKAVKTGVTIERAESEDDIREFAGLYRNTMERVKADSFYFFPDSFFTTMHTLLRENFLLLVARLDGVMAAGAIFLKSPLYFHYHLAGSRNDCRKAAPNNLLLHEAILEAVRGKQVKMHLGGGSTTVTRDTLFKFKTNFSPLRARFFIGTRIHQPDVYEHLRDIWLKKNPGREEELKTVLQVYRF